MKYFRWWVLSAAVLGAHGALAANVVLVGLFPGKAVLMIDGGPPRSVAVGGRTPEGIRLLEADRNSALVEIEGRRERLTVGGSAINLAPAQPQGTVTHLSADGSGHYFAQGSVNGVPLKFLVDTGATVISMGVADARRIGIQYRTGRVITANTANGPVDGWLVKLDTVKVGDIVLYGVEAMVQDGELPFALLGMSFLNRTDMLRQGDRLTLRQRF